MTVMIGGQPIGIYRKYYSELDQPVINHSFIAHELVMFVYDEPMESNSVYLSYRILPIGRSN